MRCVRKMQLNYLNPPVRREFLGFGPVQVPRNTAFKMRSMIKESATNEYVRKWAEKIVEGLKDRDEYGEVNAIFSFLQRRTRYAKDPRGFEYVQTPHYVLQQIDAGIQPNLDCDDYTVTGLSLLTALGYPTVIRVVSFNPKAPFSHVYGIVNVKGKWVTFDPVRKDVALGWEAPGVRRRMDVPVT